MLFWSGNLAAVYTWLLYPLGLRLLAGRGGLPGVEPDGPLPSASLVLCAHNEGAVIAAALDDLLALDYPSGRLEIIVVSDGSTDATNEIVRTYADRGVRLLPIPRMGVTAALAQGVAAAANEVIVRADADTRHRPDFLRCLLRHYADPRVGAVGGSFSFMNADETGITRSEGVYWRFEMALRAAESAVGVLSTASSAAMSFRLELFEPFSPAYSEDVVIPKLVVKKGYRVVHAPEAVAYEVMPKSIGGEFRARKRMVARGLAGLFSPEGALDPRTHPGHWVAAISHKLLRWCTPVFMLGSLLGALLSPAGPVTRAALAGHLALYLSALAGFALERRRRPVRPFSAAFSFCLANAGFLAGIVEAVRGRRISTFGSQE